MQLNNLSVKFLGFITSKRRLGNKIKINKVFPSAIIGDMILNVVNTKKNEYHYLFTKINHNEWRYYKI